MSLRSFTLILCAMKSRTLQAALLGIALFFVSWLVLSSNSHAPSKLLSTSRSFSAQPVTDVSATELSHGKAGTPDGAGSSFLTDEQVEVLRKAGLLTPAQLDQLEKAAKHWKEMPDHMNYETVDEAARHRSDPIPNGRPPMPEVAPGLTLDPHKSFVDPHYDSSPVPVDTGAEVQDPRLLHDIMESINDLGHTRFWRMDCPGQFEMGNRYQELNLTGTTGVDRNKIKYFFALDLTQIARILPRLMGTIVQVIKFLGPEHCAVSIVEGRSTDGTYLILYELGTLFKNLGVEYYLQQSDVDPHGPDQDRIGGLSILRNLAMYPLISERKKYSDKTITMFVNDVALCPDDILELLIQHVHQNASMTCAMDWVYGGDVFYDAWVSRSMSGNTFFEISQDVSWAFHKNLFWDEPVSRAKYRDFQPFQCFSCWGGMVTLDSRPFQNGDILFRNSTDGECYAGEPTTLASDLHRLGLGKIATVPAVNVAYNDHEGSITKHRRGYVHDRVNVSLPFEFGSGERQTNQIEWRPPPGQIKCMPHFGSQTWTKPF